MRAAGATDRVFSGLLCGGGAMLGRLDRRVGCDVACGLYSRLSDGCELWCVAKALHSFGV